MDIAAIMAVGAIRYCVQRYIAEADRQGFSGNNRGPTPNDPIEFKYKSAQWASLTSAGFGNFQSDIGVTHWLATGMSGKGIGKCDATGDLNHPGGPIVTFVCVAHIGIFPTLATSPIITKVQILEATGGPQVVSATGTLYPSLEVWRYSDGAPPQGLWCYDASGGNPMFNLLIVGLISNTGCGSS